MTSSDAEPIIVAGEWARILFFGGLISTPLYFVWRTANPLRHWSYVSGSVVLTGLSGLYLGIANGYLDAPSAWLDPLGLILVCTVAAFLIAYITDFYLNVDELARDRAYVMYGRTPLAGLMILSAVTAIWLVAMAWATLDPAVFEERPLAWSLFRPNGPLDSLDVLLFAVDQTAKAILFDVFEVYQIGLTTVTNDPDHTAFSTLCFVYRTAVQAFVTVLFVRLVMRPSAQRAAA